MLLLSTPAAYAALRAPRFPGLWRDPVLLVLLGAGVLASGWYLLGMGTTGAQVVGYWLAQVPIDASLVVLAMRVARLPGLPPPARRFWRAFALASPFFVAADLAQLMVAVKHPVAASAIPGTVREVFLISGIAFPLWAMLTFPTGAGTRRERIRFWLDAGTVMVAAAVFAWYFLVGPGSASRDAIGVVGSLLAATIELVAAFAVVKLLITGAAGFVRPAAVAGAAGVAIQSLAESVTPAMTGSGRLTVLLTLELLGSLLIISAPRIQEVCLRADPQALVRRQHRPFSLLPYAAIAATFALLIVVLARGGLGVRVWGVLAGLVLITALVVIRQLAAFSDNARLLTRLDASMLELRHHEQRLRSLVQHASDITLISTDGKVTFASPALTRVLGRTPEQALGRPATDGMHPDDLPRVRTLLAELAATPRASVTYQARVRHQDGSWRWLEVISTNLRDDPAVNGIVSNAHDITEARLYQEMLHHRASHDPLTKLANRTLFTERTDALLARGAPDSQMAILLIDLDDFKAVNDTLGHHIGDALLVAVADRLRACVRPGDTVARLGGDEFAILLPGARDDDAVAVAERVAQVLAAPVHADGHELVAAASVGLAAGAPDDSDTLLRAADRAMYVAKRSGKGVYVCSSGTAATADRRPPGR